MNTEKTKKPMSRRRKIAYIMILVFFLLLGAEIFRSNTTIDVESFEYKRDSVPKSFDGVKIVSVTDYHNHGGSYEDKLIQTIKDQSPDYIFLVGDIVDKHRNDVGSAGRFFKKCVDIAPCFLVYGNHELALQQTAGEFEKYNEAASEAGVTILANDIYELERGDDSIYIAGTSSVTAADQLDEQMQYLDTSKPLLWLHHYPENFRQLAVFAKDHGFEDTLFFCGHAHGGLIELGPSYKGLFAPGQGFFPEYTSGEYHSGSSEMLLSRGCGNSGYTLRVFDPFHLIVCTLRSSDK